VAFTWWSSWDQYHSEWFKSWCVYDNPGVSLKQWFFFVKSIGHAKYWSASSDSQWLIQRFAIGWEVLLNGLEHALIWSLSNSEVESDSRRFTLLVDSDAKFVQDFVSACGQVMQLIVFDAQVCLGYKFKKVIWKPITLLVLGGFATKRFFFKGPDTWNPIDFNPTLISWSTHKYLRLASSWWFLIIVTLPLIDKQGLFSVEEIILRTHGIKEPIFSQRTYHTP